MFPKEVKRTQQNQTNKSQYPVTNIIKYTNLKKTGKIAIQGKCMNGYVNGVKRLKILIATENTDAVYSGGRYHAWGFAMANAMAGHYVHMITNKIPPFINDFDIPETFTLELGDLYITKPTFKGFDIVVGTPLLCGMYAVEYGKTFNIPSYVMVFDVPNFIREHHKKVNTGFPEFTLGDDYWSSHGFRDALRQCNRILCSTKIGAKYAAEWADRSIHDTIVLYPPINTARINPEVEKDPWSIVFVSRFVVHKGINDLFDAIHMMPKEHRPKIYMIGRGERKKYENYANVLGIADKVVWMENCSDVEKFETIARSRCMVFPSYFEGFGMPPAEALACGIPCIISDIHTLSEIYTTGCLKVKLGDKKDIYNAIEWVRTHEKECKKLGNDGKFWAENTISVNYLSKKIKQIYGRKPKIAAVSIMCNEEEFVEKWMNDYCNRECVHQVVVVEGAVSGFSGGDDNGHSTDATRRILSQFQDSNEKVSVVLAQRRWKDKDEMWQTCLAHIKEDIDIVMFLGADAFISDKTFDVIIEKFETNPCVELIHLPVVNFFGDEQHAIVGSPWHTIHSLIARWTPDNKMGHHTYMVSPKNVAYHAHSFLKKKPPMWLALRPVIQALWDKGYFDETKYLWLPNEAIKHYGYCRSEEYISMKRQFYHMRDGSPVDIKGKIVEITEEDVRGGMRRWECE